jgi:hypothetical protein
MRRGIRDFTGTTSNGAASDIEVLASKETNKKRAGKIAALRRSQAMGGIGPLDRKAPSLQGFSIRFLSWVESATLSGKSKAYYRDGWRLLATTKIVGMRLDHITKDDVELSLSGSASNANCALRTLRRNASQSGRMESDGQGSKV